MALFSFHSAIGFLKNHLGMEAWPGLWYLLLLFWILPVIADE